MAILKCLDIFSNPSGQSWKEAVFFEQQCFSRVVPWSQYFESHQILFTLHNFLSCNRECWSRRGLHTTFLISNRRLQTMKCHVGNDTIPCTGKKFFFSSKMAVQVVCVLTLCWFFIFQAPGRSQITSLNASHTAIERRFASADLLIWGAFVYNLWHVNFTTLQTGFLWHKELKMLK